MNNLEISWVFLEIADLLEIKGDNPFKIRSYRQAAHLLATLDKDIKIYWTENSLTELPGIGPALAAKIDELLSTGKLTYLKELRQEVPIQLRQLLTIPGVGPRTVHTIYKHLGVTTLAELKKAASAQQLRKLPGIGTKSELAIKNALSKMESMPTGLPLGEAATLANELAEAMGQLPQVVNIEVAGEVRRREELVNQAVLVVSAHTGNIDDIITTFRSAPYIRKVASVSPSEITVLLGIGLTVRLVVVTPPEFYTQLCYYTGSTEHWQDLVKRARQCNLELTPKFLKNQNGRPLTLNGEEDLYRYLELDYIIPELRSGRGEVLSATYHGALPQVISTEQIRGDLHLHTNWSDGRETILSLAKAAIEHGYEYIAITDHSQRLKIAHGLDAQRLAAQAKEIAAVQTKFPNLVILAGIEVDILLDGRLDLPDDVLAKLDLVIASVHSGFKQDKKTMTKRILTALRNPYVHILGHPSGRLIGRRPAYQVDLNAILEEAKRLGKILEINSSPERLDLNAEWASKAKKLDIKLAINTDAHESRRLADMEYGVSVARRAGLEEKDILNTWPVKHVRSFLQFIRGE